MAGTYSDNEIAALIRERKSLPADWRARIRLRPKRGHEERDLELTGDAGSEFRLILRKNKINPLDFSIILAVHAPQSNRLFRLRRYNGKSHEHTNHIETDKFYDFHIHMATERYQEIGTREDAYAEPTDRYGDFHGAFRYLVDDANLGVPPEAQESLFEEL
ncbi:MAG: hypothetical protein GY854_18340 [Deltaproteobacteria bacterium]|nr:hypothetical protein [Deltaproteobacteria bacterium]